MKHFFALKKHNCRNSRGHQKRELILTNQFSEVLTVNPFVVWSRNPDSNRGPTHYECVALPTEPFRQV